MGTHRYQARPRVKKTAAQLRHIKVQQILLDRRDYRQTLIQRLSMAKGRRKDELEQKLRMVEQAIGTLAASQKEVSQS